MFYIEDGRKFFYQWDIDRKLVIDNPEVIELHYHVSSKEAPLVCEVYEEDSIRFAKVPNILLQKSGNLRVYGYCKDYTAVVEQFEVKAKVKPSDYVYTETEVKHWSDLEARVEAIENGVGRDWTEEFNTLMDSNEATREAVEQVVEMVEELEKQTADLSKEVAINSEMRPKVDALVDETQKLVVDTENNTEKIDALDKQVGLLDKKIVNLESHFEELIITNRGEDFETTVPFKVCPYAQINSIATGIGGDMWLQDFGGGFGWSFDNDMGDETFAHYTPDGYSSLGEFYVRGTFKKGEWIEWWNRSRRMMIPNGSSIEILMDEVLSKFDIEINIMYTGGEYDPKNETYEHEIDEWITYEGGELDLYIEEAGVEAIQIYGILFTAKEDIYFGPLSDPYPEEPNLIIDGVIHQPVSKVTRIDSLSNNVMYPVYPAGKTESMNGITFSYGQDGYITLNGVATRSFSYYVWSGSNLIPEGHYMIDPSCRNIAVRVNVNGYLAIDTANDIYDFQTKDYGIYSGKSIRSFIISFTMDQRFSNKRIKPAIIRIDGANLVDSIIIPEEVLSLPGYGENDTHLDFNSMEFEGTDVSRYFEDGCIKVEGDGILRFVSDSKAPIDYSVTYMKKED